MTTTGQVNRTTLGSLLFWAPRVLGIGMALFLAIFAADVFGQNYPLAQVLLALLMHLIPTFVLLIGVAVAWRWELVGTLIFGGWAVFYVVSSLVWDRGFPFSVYVLIAGIPLLIGLLFLADWLYRRGRA